MDSCSKKLPAPRWEVGHSDTLEQAPEIYYPATVPGSVHLDWARTTGQPEYWKAENYTLYQWCEYKYWTYRTQLTLPAVSESERLHFTCGGIDYEFEIRVNGETVFAQEGMFTPVEVDLSSFAGMEILLEVVVYPAPDSGDHSRHRARAIACVKPPVGYGWDWHPELNPLGIWKDAQIVQRHAGHLQQLHIDTTLSDDLQTATVDVYALQADLFEFPVVLTLTDPEGKTVATERSDEVDTPKYGTLTVENPLLWWPHDHGPQNLYTLTAEVQDAEGRAVSRLSKRMGFRRAKLIMNEGAWEEPSSFPKSRSAPPIQLELNGRRIFCKGANWVPPEIFPGVIDAETYRPLLEAAKAAHFNIFRSWGGGIVNKESFFALCDEMGIMVWQDFPLACNLMVETEDYLTILDQESQSIIEALKDHPCLALWCGGNELFNRWSLMTDQHLALRLLNRNCYDLDPHTPFIPTSPIMGMGHGHYVFREECGRELYEVFSTAECNAYTEFGCPGPADVDYLKSFIPEDERFPPKPMGSWKAHHAFAAWQEGSWLHIETIRHYFGEPESLAAIVEYGQLLQSQGFKFIYEEVRRQKPRCSMALNWCYNEPWPSAANNSLLNWPHRPKPALQAVGDSCRPVLLSATVKQFQWQEGSYFECDTWLLNDHYESVLGGTLEAILEIGGGKIHLLSWHYPEAPADTNLRGPSARCLLPGHEGQTFQLHLQDSRHPQRNSTYTFAFKPKPRDEGPTAYELNQ